MKTIKVVEHNARVINPKIECKVLYIVTKTPTYLEYFGPNVGRVFVKFNSKNDEIQYLNGSMGWDGLEVLCGCEYEKFNGVLELSND
jgi:hypothetical protein